VKSTAITPALIGSDGVYQHEGPARIYTSEAAAIAAIKQGSIRPGEVMVLIGLGPGSGMPETYQITSALKYMKGGEHIPLLTDGRFSGVSTGACVGHNQPGSMGRRPIGRLRDGDVLRLRVDTRKLEGSADVISLDDKALAARAVHPDLKADPRVPADTRLWAALQHASGGSWNGCVYDPERIIRLLKAGEAAESK